MMEQTKEQRKLGLAILISLLLHFVIGYSLAAFGSAFTPAPPLEDKPVELTIVDLSATPPPLVPKDPPFMETAPSRESAEKPKEQTFESNANSIAASKLPATGDLPIPTQDGKDRPVVNLETHQFSLPTDGSKPQPEPKSTVAPESKPAAEATRPPKPKVSEPISATPEPEQLAMLRSTPPPSIKAPDETESSPPPIVPESAPAAVPRPKPELAASNYQAQKEETRITGRLTNRGPSSVNAVGTPLGRYQKAVSDAVGSRWYYYMSSKMDLISIGTAHIEAQVDAQGHVQNLRVVSNNANEAFANICLQSFQEAHIPPIPPDLTATLPEGRMTVDFSFTAYANR
jgi:outer membrane biosynthesis protein TonB